MSIASKVHVAFINNQDNNLFSYCCTIKLAFEVILNKNIGEVVKVDTFNYVMDFKDGSSVELDKAPWAKQGFMMSHKDGEQLDSINGDKAKVYLTL